MKKDADNDDKLKHYIYFSQHSENGRRPSDISFSIWTCAPENTATFTYPQPVIKLISALPVDNPSKIALLTALIIMNQNVSDLGFLSTESTGYINNIQVEHNNRASGKSAFIIRLQGTDITFRINMYHLSRASSEWLIAGYCMDRERWYASHYSVTIPPHSMSFTEQVSHHFWRSSWLAALLMWIGGLFSHSQKP